MVMVVFPQSTNVVKVKYCGTNNYIAITHKFLSFTAGVLIVRHTIATLRKKRAL